MLRDPHPTSPASAATALEEADVEIGLRLARHRDRPAVRAAGAASEIADQVPLATLCAAVAGLGLATGDRRLAAAGGRMLASFALATAAKSLAKRLVSRTRPNQVLAEGHYEVAPRGPEGGPWHSFPSGHTAGSVAVAAAFGRAYPGAVVPAFGAAAAIAAVQVPRGAHFPLDLAAGALIGLAAEAVVDRAWPALARPARSALSGAGEVP